MCQPAHASSVTSPPHLIAGEFVMSREIELSQGYVAKVDAEDYKWLNQRKWHVAIICGTPRAAHTINNEHGKTVHLYMSRVILEARKGFVVDHIDHDALNNQRDNLRECTKTQNRQNSRKQKRHTSSQFKGVFWEKRRQKWVARIVIDKRRIYIGQFDDELDAARSYNDAALEHFGEFALLNDV